MKVCEGTGLIDECRGEAVGVCFVMDELSVQKVIDLRVAMNGELRWI